MSLTTSFPQQQQYQSIKWREKDTTAGPNSMINSGGNEPTDNLSSSNVDDGLTSLSWLQNLNMCMTRLGAPTPPTPPASPICFGYSDCGSVAKLPTVSYTISSKPKPSGGRSGLEFQQAKLQSNAQTTAKPETTPPKKKPIASSRPAKPAKPTKNPTVLSTYSSSSTSGANSTAQLFQDNVDYKLNGNIKPPYSYATLICMAMKANKNKMTLSSIYKWIKENFLYYRNADPSWQNSIRHNLSLNKCFIKIPRNKDEPGKGGFWKLDPIYADTLVDGIFKKRRPNQKTGNECHKDSSLFKRKKQIDAIELSNAVSSIDNSCTYTYTLHSANIVDCDQNGTNLGNEFANEVCIGSGNSNECIIESDGNDICWNAILTDADLNELVDPINYTDSVAQIIHPIESELINKPASTAQLTAVEPQELDLIASTSSSLLEEQQLFYHESQLHSMPFENHTNNVISATSNVVTCINDTNMTGHWNEWNPYHSNGGSMQIDCTNHNAELILSQIEHGPNSLGMNEINVITSEDSLYLANNGAMLRDPQKQQPQHTTTMNDPSLSQTIDTDSQSPTATFDSNNPPWVVECKVSGIEPTSLELDAFNNLDQMRHF